MRNLSLLDFRLWVVVLSSLFLGWVLSIALPILSLKPLFLLALPIVFLFFILMIIKPKLTFGLIVFFRPILDNLLNMTKNGGDGIGIGAVLNLVILMLAVYLYFIETPVSFPPRRLMKAWAFFLISMLVASLYSPYLTSAIRLYFNYLSYLAMFLIPFFIIKNKEDLLFWMKLFASSFILPILFANLDILHGGHFYADAGMRVQGTFTHPNILAFYIVLGLTYYFYIIKSGYLKLKPIYLKVMGILILNMLAILIATKTRNAWIACGGIFILYGLLKDHKFLIILILLIPLSVATPQVRDRVKSITGENTEGYKGVNSLEWRLQMWKSSFGKIKEKPVQGYGLTTFRPMSERFFNSSKGMGAHNAYLEVLFESGAIGLICFIMLFLTPLYLFYQYMRAAINPLEGKLWAIMLSYLVGYMIICSADNLSYYLVFNWYVWFFLSLILLTKKYPLHD